ncbi:MAG: hypothetical protein KIT09_21270 [Bryobacteraceae bacterium]|nr:hypothetical protein [Bryobacteraceae bacterium]
MRSERTEGGQASPSTKAAFVPPKLTFVEPKLTRHGGVTEVTAQLLGPFTP